MAADEVERPGHHLPVSVLGDHQQHLVCHLFAQPD
jgi:hypothetical protein